MAKPGLDGHSNGAEQIAVAARDAGMEVVYQGIRLTPEQIAAVGRDEDVDVVGLSILSGSHLELVPEVVRLLRAEGVDAPVVVGGIIPEEDRALLDATAWPPSTRRRTSSWPASWTTSCRSWSATGPRRPSGEPRPAGWDYGAAVVGAATAVVAGGTVVAPATGAIVVAPAAVAGVGAGIFSR